MKKILIVGHGGREHAIAQSLTRSVPTLEILFCEDCCIPDFLAQARFVSGTPMQVAEQEAVDLVIVGPEAPLVAGLTDELTVAGFAVFGPPQAVARLEGSKSFAKDFMQKYGVRSAPYWVFQDLEEGVAYLEQVSDFPVVLKADGLAGGKGVLICADRPTALQGIRSLMLDQIFAEAGATVVIEKFLQGYEASVLAFCDGTTISPMLAAKDHKKIYEGDQGENTGGMGCVAPHPQLEQGSALWQDFEQNILNPTLQGIQEQAWDFCGIIFFGLLIQHEEGKECCYLLEYNMRFGDPEAQTVLPLLQTPLLEIIQSCLMGQLQEQEIRWHPAASCTVVAAAENYPRIPVQGDVIAGLTPREGLYLAGVSQREASFYTAGGRVLAWNAIAPELDQARKLAYRRLQEHPFRAMQYRRDIGGPVLHDVNREDGSNK